MHTRPRRHDHLTFKGNLKQTRYGWLRLTPAYSVHLVAELLDTGEIGDGVVLDPFCGTGTTALVCAERGIRSDTTDINPFLLWLTAAKTRRYDTDDLLLFEAVSREVVAAMQGAADEAIWTPPLHQIEKWWDEPTLLQLGRAMGHIRRLADGLPGSVTDLLKLAFCRTMIQQAQVSFGHQSMSFKKRKEQPLLLPMIRLDPVADIWRQSAAILADAARSTILEPPRAIHCDARQLRTKLEPDAYAYVITSPPYPNRMSYIRELRPYMYWLSYLKNGRQAGELDWEAIGGTWGCATSNLTKWRPIAKAEVPNAGFNEIIENIAERSALLSRYVHKYFLDMAMHARELYAVVQPGGSIHYIVGNSKFYDVMLPVEEIFASLFREAGFVDIGIRTIRKRTSKKELFEFVVSGRKPTI